MASQSPTELDRLKEEKGTIEDQLRSSPSAYTRGATPSSSDLYRQTQLLAVQNKINAARDKEIQDKWFSQEAEGGRSGGETGIIGKTLNVLSQPLYGIVGAIEHATGTGKTGSLMGDVNANMGADGHRTFSDLLRRGGVNGVVAAPLGFALDVMFDPVNWATAGTTAMIPRFFTGAVKGGVEGAGKALTSSALEKAATVGKYTPGLGRTKLMSNVSEKAIKATEDYHRAIGKDVIAEVSGGRGIGWGSNYRITLRDLVRSTAEHVPGGRKFLESIDYDSANWMRLARIKDSLEKTLGTGDDIKNALRAAGKGEDPGQHLAAAEAAFRKRLSVEGIGTEFTPPTYNEVPLVEGELKDVFKKLSDSVTDAQDLLNDSGKAFVSGDQLENAYRIAMEKVGDVITKDDIRKIMDAGMMDKTGIEWFDKMEKSIRNFKLGSNANKDKVIEVGEKALDGFNAFIAIFKRAKVAGSPSAWTNAIVGNPVMAWMSGINVWDPSFAKEVSNSYKIINNKDGMVDLVQQMTDFTGMERYMQEYGSEFARTTGVSPQFLQKKKELVANIKQTAADSGIHLKGMSDDDIAQWVAKEYQDVIEDVMSYASPTPTASSYSAETARRLGAGVTPYDLGTNIIAAEMIDSKLANKVFDTIAKRAQDSNNYGARILNGVFNKAINGYERIDQIYKLATFRHLTMNGVTEGELNTIKRVMDLSPEDIIGTTKDAGKIRYQLRQEKSMELANDIYLNYQAMPAAIKMLRKFPILGSPFASFMYGMTLKTFETAAYNPSVFNKVNFAIQDFGGEKSPLEKEALKSPYSSYLNDPAMFRLGQMPFFKNYPMYLNIANVLPYYSLNMFNPTERPYEGTLPSKLIELVDKSPILDDPVGQVLFDYLMVPLMIRDAQPIGAFGQPLYPKDATGLEKAGYATRSVTDALLPGVFSFGGLAAGALPESVLPDEAIGAIPGYRTRQLAFGARGKTGYGKTSKEDAASRTARILSAMAGVPLQSPVNLNFAADEVKKNNNQ